MSTEETAQATRFEPRWPAALAIVAVIVLLALLPGRVRLAPSWCPYVMGLMVLVPMAAVALTAARARWLRVERRITLAFFVLAGGVNLVTLGYLVQSMVIRSAEISGLQLLTSSIAMWVNNVLAFSLLFWHLDRGGPEARGNNGSTKPDWLFPQAGVPADAPADWRPTFVDYLYLGFSTATAFSATDAAPLTSRAKMLMMLESAVSLATMVVVASRAINILGS